MMEINCCKDCVDRHLKCHDTCEKYQTQRKARNELLEKIRLNGDISRLIYGKSKVHKK